MQSGLCLDNEDNAGVLRSALPGQNFKNVVSHLGAKLHHTLTLMNCATILRHLLISCTTPINCTVLHRLAPHYYDCYTRCTTLSCKSTLTPH